MTTIDQTTVFAVSGGAKGITARCVERLAEHYGCKFVLLGRSALRGEEPAWAAGAADDPALKQAAIAHLRESGDKPTPAAVQKMVNGVLSQREITGTLANIRAAGGEAEYHSVDITDARSVRAALDDAASRLGPVTGIIHGAGVLADKLIENKTLDDFEMVYNTKVRGLDNLLAAVQPDQLGYLVLFSSVAGFYGNVGQADYAVANEILNKAAHMYRRRYPHTRVVTVNWGPWEAGMVTPELKAYFESHGVAVIPVDVGTHMLIEELEGVHGDAVEVVVGAGISVPPPDGSAASDAPLRTHRLKRALTLKANPFLQDHVVDGKAVLPMVSAMSWMSNAGEGMYPGYRTFGFEDYRVLKGIVFDHTLPDSHTLELKEIERKAGQITLDARIMSFTAEGKPRFHYSARLFLLDRIPPMPVYDDVDLNLTDGTAGSVFYSDGTLFHGRSFQGVEQVLNLTEERVTMRCRLPVSDARYQGQFPVQAFNYFMTDIGFQSMGIWARRTYGFGSLPLRAGAGQHYADVPWGEPFMVTLLIRTHSETGLTTDLIIHDETGRVYMRVDGGEVTLSERLNALFLNNRLPEAIE